MIQHCRSLCSLQRLLPRPRPCRTVPNLISSRGAHLRRSAALRVRRSSAPFTLFLPPPNRSGQVASFHFVPYHSWLM